ncbi:MAG: Rieske (2Fe-2S) protein [Bacteroidetes bacterium]|nr:Rieske (2Fe-2S) protein [Bacteroidota bacterium]MBS1975675.1 Rieske (2Fe-2S) protein [Bacteroidota bacterium]
MERRDFLTSVGQVSVFVCAGSLVAACSKSNSTPSGNNNGGGNNSGTLISADLNSELQAIGSAKINGSVIVIRIANDNVASSFVALSLICTHMGCTVNYDQSSESFKCPCHGSGYDVTGKVTHGPAAAPLPSYTVTVANNTLTVS